MLKRFSGTYGFGNLVLAVLFMGVWIGLLIAAIMWALR